MNDKYFKKDFGVRLKEQGMNEESNIVITDSFIPLNLAIYPDGKSSMTVEINNMMATFDFEDNVLVPIVNYLKQNNNGDINNMKMVNDTLELKS